jgi:uncharacterized lipoprotein YbaY
MNIRLIICVSLLALAFWGCNNDTPAATSNNNDAPATASIGSNEITGVITYRDDSKLPSTTDVTIHLVDLSSEDKQVISETTFKTGTNGKPFPFTLPYDAETIEAGKTYGLDANIDFITASLYYTLEPIEVLNNGVKNEVVMILVKGPKPVE